MGLSDTPAIEFIQKAFHAEMKVSKTSEPGSIGRVEGHTALWDEVDLDEDVFERGAASKAARELFPKNRIKLRFNHVQPLGRLVAFEEDSKGIFYAGTISDTAIGRDVKTWIDDGVVDQSSLTFFPSKVDFDAKRKGWRGNSVRKIQEAFPIIEVSPLDLGAQPLATAAMKSLDRHAPTLAHLATLFEIGALEFGSVKSALPFRDLDVAEKGSEWDEEAAMRRVRDWALCGEEPNAAYAKAFLMVDTARAGRFEGFSMPIADVVGGELRVVPQAVDRAAEMLAKSNDFSDQVTLQRHLSMYFSKMRRAFEDDSLRAPWEEKRVDVETAFDRLQNHVKGLSALCAR